MQWQGYAAEGESPADVELELAVHRHVGPDRRGEAAVVLRVEASTRAASASTSWIIRVRSASCENARNAGRCRTGC